MNFHDEDIIPNIVGSVNTTSTDVPKVRGCANVRVEMATKHPYADQGERLKWHRTEIAQLEQKEYAAKAGLSESQYGNFETGHSQISMNGARALLETYRLSIDFIVEGNPAALSASLFRAWMDRPSDINAQ